MYCGRPGFESPWASTTRSRSSYALDNLCHLVSTVASGLQPSRWGWPDSLAARSCAGSPGVQPGHGKKAGALRLGVLWSCVQLRQRRSLPQTEISVLLHCADMYRESLEDCRRAFTYGCMLKLVAAHPLLSRLQHSKLRSRRASFKFATERLEGA